MRLQREREREREGKRSSVSQASAREMMGRPENGAREVVPLKIPLLTRTSILYYTVVDSIVV